MNGCRVLYTRREARLETALVLVALFWSLSESLRLPMIDQQVPLPESSSAFTDAARKRKEVLVELAVLLLELWRQKPQQ